MNKVKSLVKSSMFAKVLAADIRFRRQWFDFGCFLSARCRHTSAALLSFYSIFYMYLSREGLQRIYSAMLHILAIISIQGSEKQY